MESTAMAFVIYVSIIYNIIFIYYILYLQEEHGVILGHDEGEKPNGG